MNIKTIISKPIPVVWYRFKQLLKLKYYHKTQFWYNVERKIATKISNSTTFISKSSLFHDDFKGYNDSTRELNSTILNEAKRIIEGTISIFDKDYSFNFPLQWNKDWRTNQKWENKYFKSYNFYKQNKEKEYDIKFPWELSRLSFLITIAKAYSLTQDKKYLDFIYTNLKNWKELNPIAHSVNWYAMEVSVRTINVIQLRELLLIAPKTNKVVNLLNEILLLHGIFLWRNVEYTDVRANHYAANLTALLLLGTTFKSFYKEAEKWYNYAVNKTEKEFHLQFLNDGVNFEKSIPYHRFVVELFLISFLVLKRQKIKLNNKTVSVFKQANYFIKNIIKPNKLTPIIGDNDSASVFQSDNLKLNNHSNILQLSSLFLKDDNLNLSKELFYSSVELFNTTKVNSFIDSKEFQFTHFESGGFFSAKKNSNFFIADFGEVGMHGKGGHGHNDLFSFELMLDNQDIIVDPGCYTYTGDLALKSEMKASLYHNGLVVDKQEIAPQLGYWSISNIAEPKKVKYYENENCVVVSGEHEGYLRLENPVVHYRSFNISKDFTIIQCKDKILCDGKHEIIRSLHFAKNLEIEISNNKIKISKNGNNYILIFDESTNLKLESYFLSNNYGSKIESKKVSAYNIINGFTELEFSINKI